MHVVFAASECVPFAKTGGLADVVGALPRELVRLGHRVSVFLPLYSRIRPLIAATSSEAIKSLTIPFQLLQPLCEGGEWRRARRGGILLYRFA